jgi:hypothetical protein
MSLRLLNAFIALFPLALTTCLIAHAQCPVDSIVIKGRVEHAPRNPSVRVQLLYPPDRHRKHAQGSDLGQNEQRGESAEAILDGNTFTIPIEFLTNDRRTVMNFDPACNRKPQTVVITLKQNGASNDNDDKNDSNDKSDNDDQNDSDNEYDRVSLDFPRDFKSSDSQHYTLRNELVLNGQQP